MMIEEKDANVVEDAPRKLPTPRYVIRTRNLKLLQGHPATPPLAPFDARQEKALQKNQAGHTL